MPGSFVLHTEDKREPIVNYGHASVQPYPDRGKILLASAHDDIAHEQTADGGTYTIVPGDQNVLLTVGSTDINGFFGVTPMNRIFTGSGSGDAPVEQSINGGRLVEARLVNDGTIGGASTLTATVRLASREQFPSGLSIGATIRYFWWLVAGDQGDGGNYMSNFNFTSTILTFKLMNTSGTLTTIGNSGNLSSYLAGAASFPATADLWDFGWEEESFTPQTTSNGDRIIVEVEFKFDSTAGVVATTSYSHSGIELGSNGSPGGVFDTDGFRPFEISVA